MKKNYVRPTLKMAQLNMQVLLCGSNTLNQYEGMDCLPGDPGDAGSYGDATQSNLWCNNKYSIWS